MTLILSQQHLPLRSIKVGLTPPPPPPSIDQLGRVRITGTFGFWTRYTPPYGEKKLKK